MYNEQEYLKILNQAMAAEANQRPTAAAQGYRAASRMLLELVDTCASAERDAVISSAERLAQIAEKLELGGDRAQSIAGERAMFAPVPERPGVRFEDIAGLEDAKATILREIIHPMKYPELYARFGQQAGGGILLYGPPGTGKTMLAKAIAAETDADFFSIRCSDIVSKYFGEAEQRVRALFDAARASGNAIVFFDEFDALGARRGRDSSAMDRLVPELLTQMDGFESNAGRVTVIASTNAPQALDTAFLCHPRLSHYVFVDLPDRAARLYLIQRLIGKMPTKGKIDFAAAAEKTEGFNCADIVRLINDMTRIPIQRGIESGNPEQFLTNDDLREALAHARPSLTEDDLKEVRKWSKRYS